MSSESPLKDKVILVVDDEPDVLETVGEELDMALVHKAGDYDTALQYLLSYTYDVVILDEANIATAWKLIDLDDVIRLIHDKPENIELILTGRYADPRLIELADLVTDMVKVKHPYDKGILSRKGIDY